MPPVISRFEMGSIYGFRKSLTYLTYTYAANTANAALNVSSLSGYVAGSSYITITVNAGVYLWSDSIATPALTLTGGATGDTIKLVNKGFIMGKGGSTSAGGPAVSLSFNTIIDNTDAAAYIGGGGGAGRTGNDGFGTGTGGGGGAGGGTGSTATGYIPGTGGTGGAVGNSGGNGSGSWAGGGGGRIFPGTGGIGGSGAGVGGGAGGAGSGIADGCSLGTGGNGGSAGANGSASVDTGVCGGGGGGWGATGGSSGGGAGYAGGKAVALNGKTVTWVSGDTTRVYGAVA